VIIMDEPLLIALKEFEVRFSEVDSMGIVWHGSYAKYFEDGREEFGKKFGLGYMFIFRNGFYAPLVDLNFQFKKPLPYETKAIVETKYINTPAAKILFEYRVFLPDDNTIICTGTSTQVFLDKKYQLVWFIPPFYEEWKTRSGLL
jgi:acyl-CoA thioester hydrolase